MAVTIRPVSDFLVVELHAEGSNSSGLWVPSDSSAVRPRYGVVVAAGPGYYLPSGTLVPMPCEVGDTVLLQINAGTEVSMDGTPYQWVPARDLFGVVPRASLVK